MTSNIMYYTKIVLKSTYNLISHNLGVGDRLPTSKLCEITV